MSQSKSKMYKTIKGKEVLEALSEFKEPVTMDEIVRCVAENHSLPAEKVKKLVEEAVNGGVQYGFVQKHNEFYYIVNDTVDALDESSEEDEEDEVESAESVESMDSADIPPEPKAKKNAEEKSGSKHAQSWKSSKPRKVIKRDDRKSKQSKDASSDKEDNEDDLASERRRRSHKCNSDCNGFHRRRSMDHHEHLRGHSRSASRRR